MGKFHLLVTIGLVSALSLQAQTLTATNGTIQRSKSVLFSTTKAFFPHRIAITDTNLAPLEQNQFSVSLRTDFKLPANATSTYGSETYRYQLRLLNSANAAITLSGGSSLLTTSEFIINSTAFREQQLKEFQSKTQSFIVIPRDPLAISSAAFTISVVLQRKTNDTTVWKDEGAAVTLALQQENTLPQLRVHSATGSEIRLAYNYSTSLGVEVYGRWKLRTSTTLTANSFTELSGVTPIEFSPGIYHYVIPISATEPQKFFRLSH